MIREPVTISIVWEERPGDHMIVFVDENPGVLVQELWGRSRERFTREAGEDFGRTLAETLRDQMTPDPGAAP